MGLTFFCTAFEWSGPEEQNEGVGGMSDCYVISLVGVSQFRGVLAGFYVVYMRMGGKKKKKVGLDGFLPGVREIHSVYEGYCFLEF